MQILILVLVLIFSGCAKPVPPPVKPVNEEEVTWVIESLMTKWKHRRHQRLRLEHAYVYYKESFTGMRLEISSQEILEVPEARNLLVDFTEELLSDINTDPLIASQLELGNFSADNLNISINFESFYGQYLDPYYVGLIKLKNGMAYYYAFNLKYSGKQAWQLRVEPYGKTREISMMERAADKEFEAENPYFKRHEAAEGIFAPVNEDEFIDTSPLRRF